MFQLHPLPIDSADNLETVSLYRQLTRAHRFLAELKGTAATIPNENILIDTLTLLEARDSSAIENIITTQDELYQSDSSGTAGVSGAAKEVRRYAVALKIGFERVRAQGFMRLEDLLNIQAALEQNQAGLRKLPGTVLKDGATGEGVYTPPQDPADIETLMDNFVTYFNREVPKTSDPLIEMAILHYQFESIHPFYDGNGRTGRILNLIYLVLKNLLDLPILYLSRFVVRNKTGYYQGLQEVRDSRAWENWVLYLLQGVETTARETLETVVGIRELMADFKERLRVDLPKIYSHDLLNNLFRHPYTKIEFLQKDLQISQPTAAGYLNQLAFYGFVRKTKIRRTNFYINEPLFNLLSR